jgi:hypothetical protein
MGADEFRQLSKAQKTAAPLGRVLEAAAPAVAASPLVAPIADSGDVAAKARKRRASAAHGSILSDLDAEYLG